MTVAVKPAEGVPLVAVDDLIRRARTAIDEFASADQARVDEAVVALAWSLYKPEHARELAKLAVEDTGLGNVADKIIKKQRKTFGTLRDLLRVRTVGVIEEEKARGIVKYAKPVGVVAAITPSTNPGATPVNKAMMAIKGRNAVIIAASPAGMRTTTRTVACMRAELKKIGLPEDLVQILPPPASKEMTQALMRQADLVVATGSQDNVRRAYSSGTPAIGVGTGNVPVIIDETADLDDAAQKICASKIFDNATSCSSENSVVILDAIYGQAIAALERAGGYMASPIEKERIQRKLWQDGKLNRHLIARDADVLARRSACRSRPSKRSSSWLRRQASAATSRFPARSWRWCSRSIAREISTPPLRASMKLSLIKAAVIPAGCTRRSSPAHTSSPNRLTWCACSSTRLTRSATAAASTTGSTSRSAWGAGPGAATASAKTSTTGTSSTLPIS